MFSFETPVSVTKLDVSNDPEHETPSWDEHDHGSYNPNTSLPVYYNVKGTLIRELTEGSPMFVERHKRNGKKKAGIMQTSPVQNIREDEEGRVLVETMNSIYSVEKIGIEELRKKTEP